LVYLEDTWMRRRPWALWLAAGLFVALAPWRPALGGTLDPQLSRRIAEVAPSEAISVLVQLRSDPAVARLRAQTRGMAPVQRRELLARALRETARQEAAPVRRWLEAKEGAQVGRLLWLAGVLRVSVPARLLADLAALPGVERILWDPPVEAATQYDAGAGNPLPAWDGASGVAWQLERDRAPEAWAMGYDGTGVVIAVVDGGMDYLHPDLADHIWVNEDEIPDNGLDDDGNGYVDDVLGWDFVDEDPDPMGSGYGDHGTLVAGLAAGDGTSGLITGVAPGAVLMPLRGAGGTWGDVLEALQYAVDNGARIISMSLSQKWRFDPKPDYALWRTVMDNERDLGILHANSIGNEGDNRDTDPIPFNISAPGNCPPPWVPPDQWLVGGTSGVLAVGAIDSLWQVANSSSRGPSAWEDIGAQWPEYPWEMPPEYQDYPWSTGLGGLIKPDLVAPGPGTISTSYGGGYETFSGTSAATPQVAGAMAILLQAVPTLGPEEAAVILMTSARDLGEPGKDNAFGAGALDVAAALELALAWSTTSVLSGRVTDAVSGELVTDATVAVAELADSTATRSDGSFLFVLPSGSYLLRADEFLHYEDSLAVVAAAGFADAGEIALAPRPTAVLSGTVTEEGSGQALAGVRIRLPGAPVSPGLSGLGGGYLLPGLPAGREVVVEALHFGHEVQSVVVTLEEGENVLDFSLPFHIVDDFEHDLGWTLDPAQDDALEGLWERVDPVPTYWNGMEIQPGEDASPDPGRFAYVTGNNLPGADQDWNDVDGGRTTLLSPVFDPTAIGDPMLRVRTWYSNDTGDVVDDAFRIEVSPDGGQTWVLLEAFTESHREWRQHQWDLADYVPITPTMRLRFVAEDAGGASVVEAAVDEVEILQSTSSAPELLSPVAVAPSLGVWPNPFQGRAWVRLALGRRTEVALDLVDVSGRRVRRLWAGPLDAGEYRYTLLDAGSRQPLASGIYFLRLAWPGGERCVRLVRIR
jgi:subtilisin family serine protease